MYQVFAIIIVTNFRIWHYCYYNYLQHHQLIPYTQSFFSTKLTAHLNFKKLISQVYEIV
jgi:hypothetical protein